MLLVNLGTPDSTAVADVRRYLAQFSDGPARDRHPVARLRAALVHGIILRTRPRKSAEAYRKVWTERGSPLLFHGQDLATGLQDDARRPRRARRAGDALSEPVGRGSQLRSDWPIDGADDIVVVPLFPQYSQAAWASAYDEVVRQRRRRDAEHPQPALRAAVLRPPTRSSTRSPEVSRPHLDAFGADRVLMSFHGLPEKHVRRSDDRSGRGTAWRRPTAALTDRCTRTGSATGHSASRPRAGWRRASASAEGDYEVAFQSRLTKAWIQPFTDERIEQLAATRRSRARRLCPSFVADCLETIEEIGMQAKQAFVEAGGEDLLAVPCVNAERPWVEGLAELVRGVATPSELAS